MIVRRLFFTVWLGSVASLVSAQTPTPRTFQPSWPSLARQQTPTWFVEARFGLAVQWGVSSVPAQHLDYARLMYLPPDERPDNPIWAYHQKHYGHPGTFGYKDLIPYWEARAFDPKALTAIFQQAGARYVLVTATDRDNFDLFRSSHQRWNAVRMGPHRDLVGEWAKALRAAKLRWGVGVHHGRAWWFLRASHGSEWHPTTGEHPFDGVETARDGRERWWEGEDPQALYGPPRPGRAIVPEPPKAGQAADLPTAAYQENWYLRMKELTSTYQPEIVWMSTPLPHGDWGLRWAADFYEGGKKQTVGTQTDVVLALPATPGTPTSAIVPHASPEEARPRGGRVWQREAHLAAGGLRAQEPPLLTATEIERLLSDTASQGGNLLLRIALRADGQLPGDHEAVLLEVGQWLKEKGEAIFGTEAGPKLSVRDLRVTRNATGTTWYLHFLQWPTGASIKVPGLPNVLSARWLGGKDATWTASADGVQFQLPAKSPGLGLAVLRLDVAGSESVPEY